MAKMIVPAVAGYCQFCRLGCFPRRFNSLLLVLLVVMLILLQGFPLRRGGVLA